MIILQNFTDLNENQKQNILTWRNDKEIKKWMFNSDVISLEEHLNFINLLKNDKEKQYFLVTDFYNEDIGVIYFKDISTSSCTIGLYAKTNLKNVGNILMEQILKVAFNKLHVNFLKVEVFEKNIKAIKLYTRYKFKAIRKTIFKNKIVIQMELKEGNRP
ncbi:MAG: UDP-4-amino-4,6-dideoxy-N-acetyl-beta-L-altrosamine N-acetyltransferase [Epsilonproteobacteria bacterium]|nr:UDP-4-amino-4,6-dideoxy-N-acetyl-beta-L-altrosamine N-acetyltransferase [Campylobacterota bacterium]